MRRLAKNLHIGDKIEVAGMKCRIRGIQENAYKGIVLEVKIKGVRVDQKTALKRMKARRRARATVIVSRNAKLKLL